MDKAKPFSISKQEVWEAYKRVKANQGAAGVYKISRATVIEKRRPSSIGSQVAMYLARRKTDLGLKDIGGSLGGGIIRPSVLPSEELRRRGVMQSSIRNCPRSSRR